ncbi:MAG: thiamine phosphate synthase [Rhodospirillales bacterium]|nr:thiamine phosphate synthase [Rhodospirillales bacterium]
MSNLSNIAGRLNLAAGAHPLPPVILMTDAGRLPDPLEGAAGLPAGAAVLLRHYGSPARARMGEALAEVCRSRRLDLIVAGDGDLARRLGAQGLHVPSWFAARDSDLARREVWQWRRRPGRYVTAAVHGRREMERALALGADALIVAPVFATESHPAARPLGIHRLAGLVKSATAPVYALGGISAANAARLGPTGAAGIAGIGGILA